MNKYFRFQYNIYDNNLSTFKIVYYLDKAVGFQSLYISFCQQV